MTTLSKVAPSDCQDGELPALIVGIVLSVVYMIYGMSFPGRAVLGRIEEEPFLARVHIGTHKLLELTDVLDDIGEERIFPTVRSAVNTVVATAAAQDKEK